MQKEQEINYRQQNSVKDEMVQRNEEELQKIIDEMQEEHGQRTRGIRERKQENGEMRIIEDTVFLKAIWAVVVFHFVQGTVLIVS